MINTVITSSVLILGVLLIRRVFRGRVRQTLVYGAWLLVALHLLIPVKLFSLDYTVLGAVEPVIQAVSSAQRQPILGQTREELYAQQLRDMARDDLSAFAPAVQQQIRQDAAIGIAPEDSLEKIQSADPDRILLQPDVQQALDDKLQRHLPMPTFGQIASVIWFVGVALMGLWFVLLNLRHRQVILRSAQELSCPDCPVPVYVSDQISSPCLVGFFRPMICLTPECAEDADKHRHVLAHETVHWRHWDHVWALLRCICLCIYWFHPLVWEAALRSRRDCELACDEGAIAQLGEEERIPYGKTLLEVVSHANTPVRILQTATTMNETKRQLMERIQFIAKKQKIHVLSVSAMAAVCLVFCGVCYAEPAAQPYNETDRVTVYLLTEEKNPHYHKIYTYDDRGQLRQMDEYLRGGEEVWLSAQFRYDVWGNLTYYRRIQPEYDHDRVYTYRYTYADVGQVASFHDDQTNRTIQIHYDAQGRFTKATTWELGQEWTIYSVTYDDRGNVIQVEDSRDWTAEPMIITYSYNEADMLVSRRSQRAGSDSFFEQKWQYPALGTVVFGEYTAVYQDGRLYSIQQDPSSGSKDEFEVDEQGNLIRMGETEFIYTAVELTATDAALSKPYLLPYMLEQVFIDANMAPLWDPLRGLLPQADVT